MPNVELAVCVPTAGNSDGYSRLHRVLCGVPGVAIYTVANGSPRETLDLLPGCRWHAAHDEPVGYTAAQNEALAAAWDHGHAAALMLNDDAFPATRDPFEAIWSALRPVLNEGAACAGPHEMRCCATGLRFLVGWCLAVPRGTQLDVDLPGGFGTDVELCARGGWVKTAGLWEHDGSRTVRAGGMSWEEKVLGARRILQARYGTPIDRLRRLSLPPVPVPKPDGTWLQHPGLLAEACAAGASGGWLGGPDGQRARYVRWADGPEFDGFVGAEAPSTWLMI